MSSVDQKLDLLINSITKIEKKLDGFGERINKIEEIYKNQENRTEERFQRLNDYFEGKVKILSNRILDAETFKTDFKKAEVMRENYEKRMNILIHGIEEDTKSVWESNVETRLKFNNFRGEGGTMGRKIYLFPSRLNQRCYCFKILYINSLPLSLSFLVKILLKCHLHKVGN